MKKIIEFLFGKKEHPAKKHPKHTGCDFKMKGFNKTKRTKQFVEELNLRADGTKGKPSKPPKPTTTSTTTTTTIASKPEGCIFLAFEGGSVTNTSWNWNGPINCEYSGLSDNEKLVIIESVMNDFSIFNVTVTTDEAVYNSWQPNRRIRCLITESHEWYGNGAGGVAFIGSFTWGDNTPCFVFSSLLGYDTKFIMEAITHEVGHTLNLQHQSLYDENCNLLKTYNNGGDGEAPIMGVAYYQPIGRWWIGPTIEGCNMIQDDIQKISQILTLK